MVDVPLPPIAQPTRDMQESEREQYFKSFRTFYLVSRQLENRLHTIEVLLCALVILGLVAMFDRVAEKAGLMIAAAGVAGFLVVLFLYHTFTHGYHAGSDEA